MKKRYHFSLKNCLWLRLTIILVVFFSINVQAQKKLVKEWERSYGGSESDGLNSAIQTPDGGVLLGGTSFSGLSGDKSQKSKSDDNNYSDFWIIKLDAKGHKQWDRTIGGSLSEILSVLALEEDGYILAGSSDSGKGHDKSEENKGGLDCWIVKVDFSGNKVWDKTFGRPEAERIVDLKKLSDDGYLIGALSSDFDTITRTGLWNAWLIKTDSVGIKKWDKLIKLESSFFFKYLLQTSDNGFVLGGILTNDIHKEIYKTSFFNYQYRIVKLDDKGNILWDKIYEEKKLDKAPFVRKVTTFPRLQQTKDGGYFLGGTTIIDKVKIIGKDTLLAYEYSGYILKLDADGNKVWDKHLGYSKGDILASMLQTNDQGYILAGYSGRELEPETGWLSKLLIRLHLTQEKYFEYAGRLVPDHHWVIKLDQNGQLQWQRKFRNNKRKVYSISRIYDSADGGYFLTGSYFQVKRNAEKYASGFSKRTYTTFVTKLNDKGKKTWTVKIPRKLEYTEDHLEVTADGGFILWRQDNSEKSDYWIVKYGPKK